MRRTVLGLSLIFAGLTSAFPAYSAEKKPVPIHREAPPLGLYDHCIDPDNVPEDGYVGSVTVEFALYYTGRTKDIEAISSTDPCLEASAKTMVSLWLYNPHTIPVQTDKNRISTTIKFQFFDQNDPDKEQYLEGMRELILARRKIDHDAEPIHREPPDLKDFQKCIKSAESRIERVIVAYDISPEGRPYNIGIMGSTDPCYEEAAAKAVEEWEYGPRMIDGKPASHTDIITTIEFRVGR